MNEVTNQADNNQFQEIDLIEMLNKIWAGRLLIAKVCGIAAIVAIIVAYSFPREYTTKVELAPEKATRSTSSTLGALASLAGISINSSTSQDGLSEDMYPRILSSTPFLTGLFDVQVESQDGKIKASLYDYLSKHYSSPWWSSIIGGVMSIPSKIVGLFKSNNYVKTVSDGEIDLFNLSLEERGVAELISSSLEFKVDAKSGTLNLSVTMQDPLISAQLADTVMNALQEYITAYRTDKARKDLDFTIQMYEVAKKEYEESQQNYASFYDANKKIFLESVRVEKERLKNETDLAYQTYSQMALQLQSARAKVQEITPVYTVVQPPLVPIRASFPNKMLILIGFVFMGFFGTVCWLLFIEEMFVDWKNKSRSV